MDSGRIVSATAMVLSSMTIMINTQENGFWIKKRVRAANCGVMEKNMKDFG